MLQKWDATHLVDTCPMNTLKHTLIVDNGVDVPTQHVAALVLGGLPVMECPRYYDHGPQYLPLDLKVELFSSGQSDASA